MSKFFVDDKNISKDSIIITGEDVSHIKKVLRLKAGDDIVVCNGRGTDYSAKIIEIDQNYINLKVIESHKNITEPPVEITLFQGIPKADKMDFIIQKSIELGVFKVVPVMTERTIVRFEQEKDHIKKTIRWQKIALEAAKQCNRGIIPVVLEPLDFQSALKLAAKSNMSFIPYENELKANLKAEIHNKQAKDVSIVIGPEGGFSEKEIRLAEAENIKPVTLGPRILRTETAGIAVISIIMYELGDFSNCI